MSFSIVRTRCASRTLLSARSYSTFKPPAPAPPALSAKDQAEWTKLQKSAEERGQQVYFHPDVRRKPQPDFEGDRNPLTGEVGGPKNDPLRHGDYSYGGRCTDF